MKHHHRTTCLSALLVLGISAAHADILAGKFGLPATTPFDAVAIFGDAMNGNTELLSHLGGPATTIETVGTMTYDPVERTLLVADFYGQQILVFDRAARLDSAPLRRFNNPLLGQPRVAVPIPGHGEYAAINSSFLMYFASNATGAAPVLRSSTYQPSLIDNLGGLVYLPASDEVAVGDYQIIAGVAQGEVLFFARTDSGTITPTRRIAGPATMLGEYVVGLAADPQHNELYVLSSEGSSPSTNRVLTFALNATGDVAPLRQISGAATLLEESGAISYYAFRDELLVTANANGGGTPRILGFPRTTSGNIAPPRNIGGPDTGALPGDGWRGVVGVPLELIFANGLE